MKILNTFIGILIVSIQAQTQEICISEPVVCKSDSAARTKFLGCCVFNGTASAMHWVNRECVSLCQNPTSPYLNEPAEPNGSTESKIAGKEELNAMIDMNVGGTNTIQCYGYVQDLDGLSHRDVTEGFAAFDSENVNFSEGGENLDIGGGRFDDNTKYLKECYGVINSVYDPFGRDFNHNRAVLRKNLRSRTAATEGVALIQNSNYDTITVISVLNVIQDSLERQKLIQFARSLVKPSGHVYFRIYEGNKTKIPSKFQNNRRTESYLNEIQSIFGTSQVKIYPNENLIVAIRSKKQKLFRMKDFD